MRDIYNKELELLNQELTEMGGNFAARLFPLYLPLLKAGTEALPLLQRCLTEK